MTSTQGIKNYYAILGLPENASLFEIESAYEKLAAKFHPDKHKEHRKTAQAKFHEISQAFQVLSDRNKRSHYDELLSKQYSLQDANLTFDSFYNEHGILDEQEQKFFNNHYPNPLNNYYKVLGLSGLSKNATFDDIKNAYRKLSIKYHPKNNPNDEAAHNKFIEVNEAFNALSDQFRKQNYDNIVFGQIQPFRAHSIFDDFFGNRFMAIEDDVLKPMLYKTWSRNLDKMMINEEDQKNIQDGQTIKTSSVYSNKNGKEEKKTVTTKKNIKGGKVQEQITEQYLFPNGDRNIIKKHIADGKIDQHKYILKQGEQLPKQLKN